MIAFLPTLAAVAAIVVLLAIYCALTGRPNPLDEAEEAFGD